MAEARVPADALSGGGLAALWVVAAVVCGRLAGQVAVDAYLVGLGVHGGDVRPFGGDPRRLALVLASAIAWAAVFVPLLVLVRRRALLVLGAAVGYALSQTLFLALDVGLHRGAGALGRPFGADGWLAQAWAPAALVGQAVVVATLLLAVRLRGVTLASLVGAGLLGPVLARAVLAFGAGGFAWEYGAAAILGAVDGLALWLGILLVQRYRTLAPEPRAASASLPRSP